MALRRDGEARQAVPSADGRQETSTRQPSRTWIRARQHSTAGIYSTSLVRLRLTSTSAARFRYYARKPEALVTNYNWCDTRSLTMSGRADRRAGPCGSAAQLRASAQSLSPPWRACAGPARAGAEPREEA
jgi:hypothetical protein